MHFIIIAIVFIIICMIHHAKCSCEAFENKMVYAGQDFAYNNNPRDPNFYYTAFIKDTVMVQNPYAYKNKSLYSIDY